jgi:arylsulfatase A-like enzyme
MPKPHVIFIMADQLRYDVLDAYGDQQCSTPKIDILASRSTIFDQHYTPGPLCVPSRSSTATGLYPHQHGAIINGWFKDEREHGEIKPDVDLIYDRLTDSNYRVVHGGVQMFRMVPEFDMRCPDVEFVGPPSVGRHHKDLQERNLILGDMTAFRDPVIDYNDGMPIVSAGTAPRVAVFPLREDLFYDMTIAEKLSDLIREHDPDKPLALMANFWLPHPPLWAPRQFAEMIDPMQIQLPPTIGHWFGGMPAMQLANLPGQLGAHITMDQWRLAWSVYMGMVSLLDKCIGRLLAALDHANMFDDSLIIFTSDHGDMLGSHRMYQKMCLYDESARVPMFIKLPGQTSTHHVNELTSHLDISATILEVSGNDPIKASVGKSLKDVCNGQLSSHPRKFIFSSYDGNAGRSFAHRMARSATHKLIHNIGDIPEIYDMIEDPYETKNLAGKKRTAKAEKSLRSALNQWMEETGDDQPRLL